MAGNTFGNYDRKSHLKRTIMKKTIFLATMVAILLSAAVSVTAQTAQARVSNSDLRTLVSRIETRTDTFQNTIDRGTYRDPNSVKIKDLVRDMSDATDTLRSRVDADRNASSEVNDLLSKATLVNRFVTQNKITGRAATQWEGLKTDLNTLAGYYRLSWNWNGSSNTPGGAAVYTATDQQLRTLITQIGSRTISYKQAMDNSLDGSVMNNSHAEDSINSYIGKFQDATNHLKDQFASHRSTGTDASEVLTRARYIDQFMTKGRTSWAARNQWTSLRTDLDTLATYYRVSWNWNETAATDNAASNASIDARMTGTYRLNASRSDSVANVINAALGNSSNGQRDNMRQNLERRLASPEMIAFERRNRQVSIASSNAPKVTFDADGVAKSETNDRGRKVTTTTSADNSGVLINYEGDRMNDFYVTFSPGLYGQLNVSRRIYLENQNETITVSSVYDKTNTSAQWSAVSDGSSSNPVTTDSFHVANGVRLNARLRQTVNTKSQVGDRFVMDVTSGQYSGAVLEGKVTQAGSSGRFSGRANISLDFETVKINGTTYLFDGIIESVSAANGDMVRVNNEGTTRGARQTTQTTTSGMGAVLGAIMGAIGGQGAAVDPGASAGTNSVLTTGKDTIELGPGSVFNITSSAPANIARNR